MGLTPSAGARVNRCINNRRLRAGQLSSSQVRYSGSYSQISDKQTLHSELGASLQGGDNGQDHHILVGNIGGVTQDHPEAPAQGSPARSRW